MNPLPQTSTLLRFFDFCVSSEIPLPGLPECEGEPPAWHIDTPCDDLDEEGFEWFHSWTSPDGQELMKSARKGSDYLLECLGLARFRIDFTAQRITPQALAGCEENSLVHLLMDQVLPRAACHQGRLVMHASAVRLKDGRIIAFSGPSGRGKSTLALAFKRAGHEVITDDCLLLEQRDGHVKAIPAYPSMRLWPDSLAALAGDERLQGVQVSSMAHYTSKKQLRFAPAAMPAAVGRTDLSALYLLAEPGTAGENRPITIEPVFGSTAIMALIEPLFALDVRDRDVMKSNFARVGRMAGAVPIFHLAYPRDFSVLPEVVGRLSQDSHI